MQGELSAAGDKEAGCGGTGQAPLPPHHSPQTKEAVLERYHHPGGGAAADALPDLGGTTMRWIKKLLDYPPVASS
jgi:hypothetical protein